MKAMILAAGLGTRLRPLTDNHPKALVEIAGRTLLEITLARLRDVGVGDVIINVHHFAEMVQEYLRAKNNFGMHIEVSREDVLLDTGGGLKKAAWFFADGGPFFVRNVDVISDLDLNRLKEYHQSSNALASLVVRKRETSRYFLFDKEHRLCGWTNQQIGERIISVKPVGGAEMFGFSGIQIINPEIFSMVTEDGRFSLTNLYLRLAKDQLIKGYLDTDSIWKDAGKTIDGLM